MDYNKYIHEHTEWPQFKWDAQKIGNLLAAVRHEQGVLGGKMEAIGLNSRRETTLQTFTQDVIKSSEIEGEHLDYNQVRSSIARHLGMDSADLVHSSRDVDGVVEMVLDATRNFDEELTEDRLFSWHSSLFPSGRSGFHKIQVGTWRKGQMQVVSGPIGKEKVHFEAPSADRVEGEMKQFLKWYNEDTEQDFVLKSGIAHFWFETIHPFDDGNGRIGRALCDLLLAKSERNSHRFYSLSAQIQMERTNYYLILEQTSKGDMDITLWLEWYLNCLQKAIDATNTTLKKIFMKTQYWDVLKDTTINERQRKILNLIFDGEFFGNLTTSKWAKICKCSQDTAQRDIVDLVKKNILEENPAGGRSTSYSLVELKTPRE